MELRDQHLVGETVDLRKAGRGLIVGGKLERCTLLLGKPRVTLMALECVDCRIVARSRTRQNFSSTRLVRCTLEGEFFDCNFGKSVLPTSSGAVEDCDFRSARPIYCRIEAYNGGSRFPPWPAYAVRVPPRPLSVEDLPGEVQSWVEAITTGPPGSLNLDDAEERARTLRLESSLLAEHLKRIDAFVLVADATGQLEPRSEVYLGGPNSH